MSGVAKKNIRAWFWRRCGERGERSLIVERSLAAKLHDILKLTGDSKMHFCPERCAEFKLIKDADLKNALKAPLRKQALDNGS